MFLGCILSTGQSAVTPAIAKTIKPHKSMNKSATRYLNNASIIGINVLADKWILMNFSDALKNNIDDLNEGLNEELNEDLYDETESLISFGENGSIESDLIAIQELLINLTEQTEEQHQQIASLANAFNDIAAILRQMQSSNLTAAIEAINQNIDVLSQALINIYKHQEKNNPATELKALKTSQQALQKIVETNHQTLLNKNPASHLHWKQTTAIIVITALLSSLCSFAIGQITQPNKPEPTIPVIKKSPKPKKTSWQYNCSACF